MRHKLLLDLIACRLRAGCKCFVRCHMDEQRVTERPFGYDIAMRRLVWLAIIGSLVLTAYSLEKPNSLLDVLSLSLMTAGSALLAGGLLGFLFGVPHTREVEPDQQKSADLGHSKSELEEGDSKPRQTAYKPNTSLEQISDWLSKIIVGVGLVEIKTIPTQLRALAKYLATGSDRKNAESVLLTTIVYFAVCGFVFGFLWARIYLRKWFKEADEDDVKRLDDKLNQLERRHLADAKALALVNEQLNRGPDDAAASEDKIASTIRAASTPIKIQIFDLAERASDNQQAIDYHLKNHTAVSIFKGLIASDDNRRYHRNFSELSYALSRSQPPDLQGAESAISAAMESRDRFGLRGWKYYELRRARYRIQMDSNYRNNEKSAEDVRARIIADLKIAFKEHENGERWLKENPDIGKWVKLNNVGTEWR